MKLANMQFKTICVFLLFVIFFLLLNQVTCIANYQHQNNLISDDDRRAANHLKHEEHKRGLYESSRNDHRGHTYPSGYSEAATFTNPGHSYAPSAVAHYYPSAHSSYGSFGQTGHGTYGYGHSAPAQSYGHKGLTFKGLLIPLAGIALLGAAAALSTNPVLLQLGVINGKRRRRRTVSNFQH